MDGSIAFDKVESILYGAMCQVSSDFHILCVFIASSQATSGIGDLTNLLLYFHTV